MVDVVPDYSSGLLSFLRSQQQGNGSDDTWPPPYLRNALQVGSGGAPFPWAPQTNALQQPSAESYFNDRAMAPEIVDPSSYASIMAPVNRARDFWADQAKPYTDTYRYLTGQMPASEEPGYFGEAVASSAPAFIPGGKIAAAMGLGSIASRLGFKTMAGAAEDLPRIANPIRAYHGSPHDFSAFDQSKIGSGEGAQAYGHGLYFAEHEPTAKYYRDRLEQMPSPDQWISDYARMHLEKFGSRNAAISDLEAKNASPQSTPGAALALLKDPNWEWKPPGHMYEVALHADPEHFLDWDKPLVDQSTKVKDFATQYYPRLAQDAPTGIGRLLHPIQSDLHNQLKQVTGEELYRDKLTSFLGGGEPMPVASDKLRQAGIPGIKYLDARSRAAGDGTRNYVVFDPRIVEILRKYGLLGPAAGLSQFDDNRSD